MRAMLISFVIGLLVVSTGFCLTYVAGTIGGQTWDLDGSPYILTDDVTLSDGSTLEIAPGVVVRGAPGATFFSDGELLVEGTEDNPVLFTEDQQGAGWGGFIIENNDEATVFNYAIIEYGRCTETPIHGGAINIKYSDITLTNCEIRYNSAPYDGGGVLFLGSDFTVINTYFHDNVAGRFGGAIDFSEGNNYIFRYNVISNNYANEGGAILLYDGDYIFDHVDIINNEATVAASEIYSIDGNAIIYNSIIWNNLNEHTLVSGNGVIASYSCLSEDVLPGSHQIIGNPLFVDIENNDYHLTAASPCIDTGCPDSPLDPDSTRTDIGAFYFDQRGGGENLEVIIPHIAVSPGSAVQMPISITNTTGHEVMSLQCDIVLPEEVLGEITDVIVPEGGPVSPQTEFFWNVEENVVHIAMAGPIPFMGEGPFVALSVDISPAVEEGTYPVTIENMLLNEGVPDVVVQNGAFVVTAFPLGDVSLNGVVQAFDASLILSWLQELVDLDELQQWLGDVSGNGELTPLDASLILQYVVGLIDHFPAQEGPLVTWGQGEPNIGNTVIDENRTALVDFQIEDAINLAGCTLHLLYDTDVLSLEDVYTAMEGALSGFKRTDDGALIFFASGENLDGEAVDLATLEFQVAEGWRENVPVAIGELTINEINRRENLGEFAILVGLDDVIGTTSPDRYDLISVFPNPFNTSATISIHLSKSKPVRLVVFDLMGREVAHISDGLLTAGDHSLYWDASKCSSGMYLLMMDTVDEQKVTPLVLIK